MTTLATLKKTLALLMAVALVLACVSPALAGIVRRGRVAARSVDTWTVWVPSGPSRIVVAGDGDTDLDCYVFNQVGTLLGFDDDSTDYCIVDVSRLTSGNLRVEVRNLGYVWNAYVLTVD